MDSSVQAFDHYAIWFPTKQERVALPRQSDPWNLTDHLNQGVEIEDWKESFKSPSLTIP
jgi:hypothetical protein